MKYAKLLLLASLFAGFTACSSGDEDDEPTKTTPTKPEEAARVPLTVEVSENPLTSIAGSREDATRTDITTLPTLTAFSMNFYSSSDLRGKYDVRKNGAGWSTTNYDEQTGISGGIAYWPNDATEGIYPFCFYAYTDGSFVGGSNPYISVEVEEAAFNQKDVLVAQSAIYYRPRQSAVALTFDHICAAVGFTIRMSEALKAKLGNDQLSVSKVRLQAIANTGKYYYDDGWKNVSNETTYYTITYENAMVVTTEMQEMKDNKHDTFYLFLIPQKTDDAELEVTYRIGEGEKKTTTITGISVDWQQGYRYYIDINLGTANIQVEP